MFKTDEVDLSPGLAHNQSYRGSWVGVQLKPPTRRATLPAQKLLQAGPKHENPHVLSSPLMGED